MHLLLGFRDVVTAVQLRPGLLVAADHRLVGDPEWPRRWQAGRVCEGVLLSQVRV